MAVGSVDASCPTGCQSVAGRAASQAVAEVNPPPERWRAERRVERCPLPARLTRIRQKLFKFFASATRDLVESVASAHRAVAGITDRHGPLEAKIQGLAASLRRCQGEASGGGESPHRALGQGKGMAKAR